MPCSINTSGSQTATLSTIHTLCTVSGPTGGGAFQLKVDAANLVNGERLTLVMQTRVRTSDTTRTEYASAWENVQDDPIKGSPVVFVPYGCEVICTLLQEGGTGRAFPWALYRCDA